MGLFQAQQQSQNQGRQRTGSTESRGSFQYPYDEPRQLHSRGSTGSFHAQQHGGPSRQSSSESPFVPTIMAPSSDDAGRRLSAADMSYQHQLQQQLQQQSHGSSYMGSFAGQQSSAGPDNMWMGGYSNGQQQFAQQQRQQQPDYNQWMNLDGPADPSSSNAPDWSQQFVQQQDNGGQYMQPQAQSGDAGGWNVNGMNGMADGTTANTYSNGNNNNSFEEELEEM